MKLLPIGNPNVITKQVIVSRVTMCKKRINAHQKLDSLIAEKKRIEQEIFELNQKIKFAGQGYFYDLETKTQIFVKGS